MELTPYGFSVRKPTRLHIFKSRTRTPLTTTAVWACGRSTLSAVQVVSVSEGRALGLFVCRGCLEKAATFHKAYDWQHES